VPRRSLVISLGYDEISDHFPLSAAAVSAQWAAPKAPAISEADGYVEIPNAACAPTKNSTYRAVFDATRPADKPMALVPALNMVGSELNALAAVNAPLRNAKFAIVFHGAAVDGILNDEHYKAKFGTLNPNLKPIAEMKKRGVEFFVCGPVFGRRKSIRKL
jgi:intracellular sulfur oxidation DsrE/DsrF family protein